MPDLVPEGQRFNFFVYIVESPSAVDLYHQRGEGGVVQQAVGLNRLKCVHRLAINMQAFEAALQIGLTEAMNEVPGCIPILHISAHGFARGIELSSGEIILWDQLCELLAPINKALGNNLIVCMSTCEGYSGSQMAMISEPDNFPFFALVGNGSKPTWPETAVAFSTFYHLLANNRYVSDAVDAMCVASGNDSFFLTTAEESKQSYLDFIARLDAAEVKEDLEQQIQPAQGGALAKFAK